MLPLNADLREVSGAPAFLSLTKMNVVCQNKPHFSAEASLKAKLLNAALNSGRVVPGPF